MRRKPWRTNLLAALALAVAAFLSGCGSDTFDGASRDFEEDPSSRGNPAQRGFVADFDLATGTLPSATDLIPVLSPQALPPGFTGFSPLPGSTVSTRFRVRMGTTIDPSSLHASSVQVFQVSKRAGFPSPFVAPVAEIVDPLVLGQDYNVSIQHPTPQAPTTAVLEITWLRFLGFSTSYMVVLTNGIRCTATATEAARPALPSDQYLAARSADHNLAESWVGAPAPFASLEQLFTALEFVSGQVQAQEAALAEYDPETARSVVLSWVFTTAAPPPQP